MIRKTTLVADAVLAILDGMLDSGTVYYTEPYQNGREHGWAIQGYNVKVAFSENRNSDSIVIYSGAPNEFDMAGNVPHETVYSRRVYFDYNQHFEAAEHIAKLLDQDKRDSALPVEPGKQGKIGWK